MLHAFYQLHLPQVLLPTYYKTNTKAANPKQIAPFIDVNKVENLRLVHEYNRILTEFIK